MIIIRFPDEATKRAALEFLIGRFDGHSWARGKVAVPEEALVSMAKENIKFTVEGRANHDWIQSLRTASAAGIQ